jgi:hypothetical protein
VNAAICERLLVLVFCQSDLQETLIDKSHRVGQLTGLRRDGLELRPSERVDRVPCRHGTLAKTVNLLSDNCIVRRRPWRFALCQPPKDLKPWLRRCRACQMTYRDQ